MTVVGSIQKITKAMKMVSAAKLTGLQRSLAVVRDFQQPITDVWKSNPVEGPFATRALVIVTSDKGLCGAMNSGLARKAKGILNEANNLKKSNPAYSVIPIGNKGKNGRCSAQPQPNERSRVLTACGAVCCP
jgi:F-type H+-transporting ATPase subunit gamma